MDDRTVSNGNTQIADRQSSRVFHEALETTYIDYYWCRLEIDNNKIENEIRPIALGRKNYLFAGSHESAQRIAMIYSLLATCKSDGSHPAQWLNHVMEEILNRTVNNIEDLLWQSIPWVEFFFLLLAILSPPFYIQQVIAFAEQIIGSSCLLTVSIFKLVLLVYWFYPKTTFSFPGFLKALNIARPPFR